MKITTQQDFDILSGTKYSVTATDPDEALAKYYASENDEPCPCGKSSERSLELIKSLMADGKDPMVELCYCVREIEADTWTDEASIKLLKLRSLLDIKVAESKTLMAKYESESDDAMTDYCEGLADAYELIRLAM